MTDTQWPRYEVFVQERPERPHQHAGSVHAPDDEIALQNARDVFVRRPECTSLWVAPAAAITGATAQALAERSAEGVAAQADRGDHAFEVFAKVEQRGTLIHIGQVAASSAEAALAASRHLAAANGALVLWVVPSGRVTRSGENDVAPMFAPASTKVYRDQAYYHVQTMLQRMRRSRQP